VVLPARNEALRLHPLLSSIPRGVNGCVDVTAIVVDDGSDDATAEAAIASGATVIRHLVSLGKGAALRTGCDIAIERQYDLIAVMDADGQHQPDNIPAVIGPLADGQADLAITYRSFAGAMPTVMRLGNWGLSRAFTVLWGAHFRDTQCGMRAFTADAYRQLRWCSNDYSVETEMLIRAACCNLRVVEVPIETVYHDRYKGTTIADGIRILTSMLRWRLVDVT
jgi:glycosyltransferase involved in cell wall biosynthesis